MMRYAFIFALFLGLSACGNNEEESENRQGDVISNPDTPPSNRLSKLDSLSRVLEKDPDNTDAYLARAEYFIGIHDYERAANDLYNAGQTDSSRSEILLLQGRMYMQDNKSRNARNAWEDCVRQFPNQLECRLELAKLYLAVNNYKKSLELINEAITIDNKDAESYFLKGLIVRDFYKDTTLALQYFQNAVDLKQDYVEALDMMGVMLAGRGDTLAKYYYQRVLDLNPNRADTYYKLGVYYMNREDWNRALENLSKATQIDRRHADSYYSMGYIHLQLNQYAKARDLFTQSIRSRESNYTAYYGRGYSFEMLGDVINAQKDYRAALQANPIYRPAKEALDRVNRTMGN